MTFEKQTQARNNASGPIGEIGQCAVLDLAFLAKGLAQENARRRITVGDRLDIHGHKYAKNTGTEQENKTHLHGYIIEPKIA